MGPPRVVLVQPQNPANVGFVARLLANFGLKDWALVGEAALLGGEAERTGAPARERLTACRVTESLPDALGDASHSLGFTARAGRHRRLIPLHEVGALQEEWGPTARPALVFGREDRGLEAGETERLTALCTIPAPGLASFNLSHAVALALYEWFRGEPRHESSPPPANPADPRARADGQPPEPIKWSSAADRARLAEKAQAELAAAGFEQHPEQLEGTLRRLTAHPLEARDLRMLERILRHARWLREERPGPPPEPELP